MERQLWEDGRYISLYETKPDRQPIKSSPRKVRSNKYLHLISSSLVSLIILSWDLVGMYFLKFNYTEENEPVKDASAIFVITWICIEYVNILCVLIFFL